VADHRQALVGSANISYRGWTTNHEMALLVTGQAAAKVAVTVERLFSSHWCIPIQG